jgi:hypothetical protein
MQNAAKSAISANEATDNGRREIVITAVPSFCPLARLSDGRVFGGRTLYLDTLDDLSVSSATGTPQKRLTRPIHHLPSFQEENRPDQPSRRSKGVAFST